jgi:hypothetical protein
MTTKSEPKTNEEIRRLRSSALQLQCAMTLEFTALRGKMGEISVLLSMLDKRYCERPIYKTAYQKQVSELKALALRMSEALKSLADSMNDEAKAQMRELFDDTHQPSSQGGD